MCNLWGLMNVWVNPSNLGNSHYHPCTCVFIQLLLDYFKLILFFIDIIVFVYFSCYLWLCGRELILLIFHWSFCFNFIFIGFTFSEILLAWNLLFTFCVKLLNRLLFYFLIIFLNCLGILLIFSYWLFLEGLFSILN